MVRAVLSVIALAGAAQAFPREILKRDVTAQTTTGAVFGHVGCFADLSDGTRLFKDISDANGVMTLENCANYCKNYNYFGVEIGIQCYCSNTLTAAPVPNAADCSYACAGNRSELCGGNARLDIFTKVGTRKGCYAETGNGQPRLLSLASYADDAMTVESCSAFCTKYQYFGLEYGRECYCGNALTAAAVPDADCNMRCAGKNTEFCGAGNRLDVYTNPKISTTPAPATLSVPYVGCFVDQGARALPDAVLSADDMTAQVCQTHCGGYNYFGVEYGRECWCGNAAPTVAAPATDCNMPCAGDSTKLCGAGNRLNVWGAPGQTTTPTNPTLNNKATVGAFAYKSCWSDGLDIRALADNVLRADTTTVETCAVFCKNYRYFGVEYGSQCYCGNTLGGAAADEADCNMPCAADSTEKCGGPVRMSVYAVAGL